LRWDCTGERLRRVSFGCDGGLLILSLHHDRTQAPPSRPPVLRWSTTSTSSWDSSRCVSPGADHIDISAISTSTGWRMSASGSPHRGDMQGILLWVSQDHDVPLYCGQWDPSNLSSSSNFGIVSN
jgi:hypothetical protein